LEPVLEAENVYRIPVYTPFGTPPTNVYVLMGDKVGLVDCGLGHPKTREELHAGLAQLGVEPEDVGVVVVTHAHVDHMGMAGEFPSAQVFAGQGDVHKLHDYRQHLREYMGVVRGLMKEWGVSDETVQALVEAFRGFAQMAQSVPGARGLSSGEVLEGLGFPLEVVEFPGHTEGLIGLYRRKDELLLSSDHLLSEITPNPGLFTDEDPPRSGLEAYVASVRGLREMDISLVLPGHGPVFQEHKERIDTILTHHEERLRVVRGAVGEGSTAYTASRRVFGELDSTNIFLAVRETFGHLEILVRDGLVEVQRQGPVDVYSAP